MKIDTEFDSNDKSDDTSISNQTDWDQINLIKIGDKIN